MKLYIEFENIIDSPMCEIRVNQHSLYKGHVFPSYNFELDIADKDVTLYIEHWDKKPTDTVVEQGKIVRDRSFTLKKLEIDDYDLEELVWQSEFHATDGAVYKSCLFFGPNGTFVLKFINPVLYWMLKTRHELHNNDPTWEQDYNYYTAACKLLNQISNK